MRMSEIEFPDSLLTALHDQRLVVFAGAGVSMGEPAWLPDFAKLANAIAYGTGKVLKGQDSEPIDRFLGGLQSREVNVHDRAAENLQTNGQGKTPEPTSLHRNLLQLYPRPEVVRIVTTNFDLLFEDAAREMFDSEPEVFRAPALPLGREFSGIVHVHGNLDRPGEMVLTDKDFGRAYLTEGWALRFLDELFRSFTVLFVGYSHTDTVMHYLARALPESEAGSRFALTVEANDDQWQVLGIEAIAYPAPRGDHSALYKGIGALANHVSRGVLDWQREIEGLARKPPSSLNKEETDLVDEALSDVTKTFFFTNAASSSEWINWLAERGHLEKLFGTDKLSQRDSRLAWWLAKEAAYGQADEIFLLIGRHGMRLHQDLWWQLCWVLREDLPLDTNTFKRWISLLLATAPPHSDLEGLVEPCIKAEAVDCLIDIFHAMAGYRLQLSPGLASKLGLDDDRDSPKTDVELVSKSDHHTINTLWEDGLKPNLDRVAEPLLADVVGHLEAQHRTLRIWQKANRKWSLTNYRREAIELPEDRWHSDPEPIDVLIDAARDCLEWLASKCPEASAQWCERLVREEAPLLRRLAVHTLSVREDLTSNEKVDWLLARIGLYDTSSAHYEIFQILKQTYPETDSNRRRALVEAVHAYHSPLEKGEDKGNYTARYRRNWFQWLHEADPDCTLVKQALDNVAGQYPDWQPPEHPDQIYWPHYEWIDFESPWTVEELLSRPAEEWTDKLLSSKKPELFESSWNELLTVKEAASRRVEWGLDLAEALATEGNWDTDLWNMLLGAWSESALDNHQCQQILQWLCRTELQRKYAREIARFLVEKVSYLLSTAKDGHTPTLLMQANEIATNLWSLLDGQEPSQQVDDWWTHAVNQPAGILTEYWRSSLSLWRSELGSKSEIVGEVCHEALSRIIQDKTVSGRMGRSILAHSFPSLLKSDEDWTKENLLPKFKFTDHAKAEDYQAIWDGFLHGPLSRAAADLLSDAFLEAVERIENPNSEQQLCDKFIALLFSVEDPVEKWIPTFFESASKDRRQLFALSIGNHLRYCNEAQQREWWQHWLCRYWENRSQGVPKPLDDREIEEMVKWLPNLKAVFPEAVDLAIRMPQEQPRHDSQLRYGRYNLVIFQIHRSDLWQSYPEAVTKLLVYLGTSEPGYLWATGRELIGELLQLNLPRELEHNLKELRARMGIS